MNIILSPHFDDAVLSLGGLVAKEGSNTVVATFFGGTPARPLMRSWDLSSGFSDSTEAMRERTAENQRALNFLGVSDDCIRTYAYLDGQYRRQKGDPVLPEPELEALIQREVASLAREFSSNTSKIFIPGLAPGNRYADHALVKRAALAAMRALPAENTVECFLYQDLPYAMSIMYSAYPRSMRNFYMRKRADRWDYFLLEQNVASGSLALTPVSIRLETKDMEKKLDGIAFYASQFNGLGKDLLKRIERFSAAQAHAFSLPAPYCEIVYKVNLPDPISRDSGARA